MQYKRISADSHLDLPLDAAPTCSRQWRRARSRTAWPYVTDTDEGPKWMARNGASFGFKNGVGPAGSKFVPGKHHRVDVMAETGLYDDGARTSAASPIPICASRISTVMGSTPK